LDYNYLTVQREFGELLCLNAMYGVEKYWHQVETVKKVLKYFSGRVLLCDEVGLGKTIEAGMLIKEYLMRGMAKNVLILTPPSLVSQWKEEMQEKFGLTFQTSEDEEAVSTADIWKERLLISSINLAKCQRNMPLVTREFYDIVVVDEAHRLRNRKTLAWNLVNQLQKKFIFLLTATPVQNNLVELFNLITLLKPGQFKTETLFKKEYVKRGDARTPVNREKLRELLRDVMIRNTRSVINLKLPKRFATTMRLMPGDEERQVYTWLQEYLHSQKLSKQMVYLLLREAGSSPYALRESLLRFRQTKELKQIVESIETSSRFCKEQALMEILDKNPQEKVIIFAQYLKTVDHISSALHKHNVAHVCFRGDMPARDKNEAIARFREEVPVLLSTESGGEGKNLQFSRTIVNFDLPWNPMKIEQRIGRLHRIGQTRDVFIFNLSVQGTIEDYILEILDHKINMFEMVIGEIEPILGYISEEDDFENIVLDIWLRSTSPEEVEANFSRLGDSLVKAKQDYLQNKAADERVFGEDYET
jgi:SNF2 family DNA or RNA helicase